MRRINKKEAKMKKIAVILIILTVILPLSFATNCLAGNSQSITISCTIPAIPGVNAPAIEEKTVRSEDKKSTPSQTQNPKIAKNEEEKNSKSPNVIQQEEEKLTMLAKEQNKKVIVQTIYSR
jgi:hypothetical protein